MRVLILFAALALPAGATAAPPAAPPEAQAEGPAVFTGERPVLPGTERCRLLPGAEMARPRPQLRVAPQKLDELPPADLMLAVWRQVGGCQEPVVVRHGFGAAGGPRR